MAVIAVHTGAPQLHRVRQQMGNPPQIKFALAIPAAQRPRTLRRQQTIAAHRAAAVFVAHNQVAAIFVITVDIQPVGALNIRTQLFGKHLIAQTLRLFDIGITTGQRHSEAARLGRTFASGFALQHNILHRLIQSLYKAKMSKA